MRRGVDFLCRDARHAKKSTRKNSHGGRRSYSKNRVAFKTEDARALDRNSVCTRVRAFGEL